MKLFRSYLKDYKDGEQLRDFIYIKDVMDVLWFLKQKYQHPGIYNLGTGKARTFNDLAAGVFKALNMKDEVEYIDMPFDIRDKYQYFTEADVTKLQMLGYDRPFYSLEEGIEDYVNNYLIASKYTGSSR